MVEIAEWTQWTPALYLRDYYQKVQPDEIETIKFLTERFSIIKGQPRMIEVGCGPTLHHVFAAAPFVSSIVMSDYLEGNLAEVQKWVKNDAEKHDWTPFVKYTLQCEGISESKGERVVERESLTRRKIVGTTIVDLSQNKPLGNEYQETWPLVLSCYCADSATSDHASWEKYMRNLASLVAPGGVLITTALRKTAGYIVGDRYFPSANIDEDDLARVLKLDFEPQSIMIEVRDVAGHQSQGYNGIILAQATKKHEAYA